MSRSPRERGGGGRDRGRDGLTSVPMRQAETESLSMDEIVVYLLFHRCLLL
ncbi:MAG: hypothetical protein MJE68_16485 [Proteobacteria bacterium]|nr:hypothetical protein [Pseudomonadota bacterium]